MPPSARRHGFPGRGYALKTYKNLDPQICSFENLYLAYRAARRGKRKRVAAE